MPAQFTYTPALGSALSAGDAQVLSVQFQPADPVNYNPASATVLINVARAPLTVTADSQTRAYGNVNPTLTAHYSSFVGSDSPASLSGALTHMIPPWNGTWIA